MSREWTDSQLKAVEARGMQVLVSAAAGSGKTSVLTERVKNILSDTDNPCSVSEILVVTFTRAAATEMRDRIYDALREGCAVDDVNSDYLRRQMTLLPIADICTMDSFCSKIVRENFAMAEVGVDFRLLDEKDSAEIMGEALELIINELYEENDDAFRSLTSMFINERDDKQLGEIITTLYEYSRSYPAPDIWLNDLAESFNCNKTPNDTVWAETIYKYLGMFCDFHYKRLMRCVALMEESGGFSSEYLRRFNATAERVKVLHNTVSIRDWDALVGVIREGLVVKVPARNSKVDEGLKKLTQDVFQEYEDEVSSIEKRTLPTIAEHKEDAQKLYPVIKKLCDSVSRLGRILADKKNEINAYSFDDVLHKAIKLIINYDNEGNWHLTNVGKNLQDKYKEILIDEYQDTNEAQNIIFEALSRDCTNLYCVGDVKQSIYRFRLASPELFMNLRRSLSDYDGTNHPSQITLDRNFRSRKGIDEAVNYVFKALMSTEIGEIDYNEREELTFGAKYYPEKTTPDTEMIYVDAGSMKSAEATEAEAKTVAEYIKRVLDSKVMITTKQGLRPIRSSDICVLLRSIKNKVKVYTEALERLGINSSAVLDSDISDSKEIRLLGAFIKTVNNPLDDISLIAVMLSPVFGFTPDEISEIRMIDRRAELYPCVEKYAENSSKARDFLKKLALYRNTASSLPMDEFVRFLVEDTGITDIFLSMTDGDTRKANIRGFIKFAEDFINSGRNGLNAFVRYYDNAVANGSLRSYGVGGGFDAVQFMSIHKSKGLEFPYVIIADCSKGFNKQDSHKSLLLSRDTGIGLKIRDDDKFTKYHTVSSAATEKSVLFGSASEELRVLYVAMTRAKEHLAFVCTVTGKATAKRVRLNNTLSFDTNGKLHPYAVYRASSMSEWLLSVFAKHKDCGIIRNKTELTTSEFNGDSFSMDTTYADFVDDIENVEHDETVVKSAVNVDIDLLKLIEDKTTYKYPYDYSGVLAKVAASSTEKKKTQRAYFATEKPAFLNESFTGASRGTAIHKFLELCDFKCANENLNTEIERLKILGILSDKEADVLDTESIGRFFDNPVGKRLLNSSKVYKEYEFAYFKKAGDLYENLSPEVAEDDIVVQGKLDCAFIEDGEAVLIDYKTDNITDENTFVQMYSPQLQIYTEALAECEGIKVKEKYIYSFKLNKFIEV